MAQQRGGEGRHGQAAGARIPTERLPHLPVGVGARRRLRLFPNDVLVGLDEARGPMFVYVVTTPIEEEWRTFAQRYGDLLGALPRWTIRA